MILFNKLLIKQFFNKYFIVILFIFLFCSGCSSDQPIIFTNNQNIKNFIKNYCPISEAIDINQNIILGTLYYKNNSSKLSQKDKMVLKQVVKAFELCHKKILVIGYCSNMEALNNPKNASEISYARAFNAYNYLQKNIPNNYLFFAFLSNFRNKYIENNETAVLGNQRVEIIMLGSGITSLNLLGNDL